MGWKPEELARIAKLPSEGPRPSRLLVEVLASNFVGGKVGQRLVLGHLNEDQVKCLIESGAVRPVERPKSAELKKEANDG